LLASANCLAPDRLPKKKMGGIVRRGSSPIQSTSVIPPTIEYAVSVPIGEIRVQSRETFWSHEFAHRLGVVFDEELRPAGEVREGCLFRVEAEVVVERREQLAKRDWPRGGFAGDLVS
jgi:hypothetical protein